MTAKVVNTELIIMLNTIIYELYFVDKSMVIGKLSVQTA